MGDGRILEWTAGFIDTLFAACHLPVQGNRTKTQETYNKYHNVYYSVYNGGELSES